MSRKQGPPIAMVSLRLPQQMLARADRLAEQLVDLAALMTSGELARSDVLRLALARGLEQLELEASEPLARKR